MLPLWASVAGKAGWTCPPLAADPADRADTKQRRPVRHMGRGEVEGAGAPRVQANARRWLLWGLAGLWLLDGVLQLQPGMFTRALITVVWQPAAVGQPGWLTALMDAAMRVAAYHLVSFNAAVALVQLTLGALLLTGRPAWVRAGLWASLSFSVIVWVCAQGLGQVLTGSASLLAGAPGSVAVYGAIAVLLLLPEGSWGVADLPARVGGGFLLLGAVLQLSPPFWTPLGLAQPFGQAYMMPQPASLRAWIGTAADLAGRWPLTFNAALVAVFAVAGVATLLAPRVPVCWAALVLVFLTWVFGQDAGMLWSGMATDPNTAPALCLLLAAGLRAPLGRGRLPLAAGPASGPRRTQAAAPEPRTGSVA